MPINPKEVEWKLIPQPEYSDPYKDLEECMTREEIDKLMDETQWNEWAWTMVELQGTYRGILTSSDYLGACSYKDQEDFQTNSGDYEDMQTTVLQDLNSQLLILTS